MNASKNIKIVLAKAGQSSAGTAVTSDAIDTAGFEGCMFVGSLGTANAANFANAAQATTSGGSYADLEDTKVVPGDDGDSFLIDVYRPQERYVRCEVDRGGTNTTTGDIYAILYGGSKFPISHGSTIDAETHISPDEGTA